MLNLHQLRVFAAVAREGTVTGAAARLRVSQPAVSKQLSELEAALGISLFDRLPRGMRLTGAGEALARHARRILASEAAAEAELEALRGLSAGSLVVGASTTIGNYLVPDLFGRFSAVHPGIGLDLEIANTAVIQNALLEDRLDLGLTEGLVSSDQLEVEVFACDRMIAIAAPDHPLLARGAVTAAEFCAAPVLVREEGSGSRDIVESALARAGIELRPHMSLGSSEALKKAVAAGMGVAIISRLAVDLELATGRLVEIPLTDLPIERSLHLLQLRGKRPSPAAAAFLELLADRRQLSNAAT
jgi:DNA-binding transcriptional LysR family regulator